MSGTKPTKNDYLRMRKLYGENKIITGAYDKTVSAKCENGCFVGKEKDGIVSFKGIPFALPPVDGLRWKAPEPPAPSEEVRGAYYFGKSPIQAPWYSELASCYYQSEDCLYLNIWTAKEKAGKLPVMVFIHGGAYGYGGTSDPLYDGHNFVKAHPEVILVTIAYRVGVMGFIDFSSVPGSEGYEDSCNLGILDQIEALKWIQKNISAFGGDADNVTIFGESAGGGSVSILPVIDRAKGLFRRVIAQSGSINLTYSKEECQPFTEKFLKKTQAKTMQELLALSTEQIYQANLPINEENNFPQRDGRLIPVDLYEAYSKLKNPDIDMICGSNKDECRYWIGEMGGFFKYAFSIPILFENQCLLFEKEDVKLAKYYCRKAKHRIYARLTEFENDIIFRVPAQKQLLLHAKGGGKTYHYFWTFPGRNKKKGACHAVELSSVFNNLQETIFTDGNVSPYLAREAQQMWVNFAKCGNPSTENTVWPPYTEETKDTLVLGEKIFVKNNLFSRRTAIIEKLLKYKVNGSYAELKLNVGYIRLLIAFGIAVLAIIATIIYFIIL